MKKLVFILLLVVGTIFIATDSSTKELPTGDKSHCSNCGWTSSCGSYRYSCPQCYSYCFKLTCSPIRLLTEE